jgi:hydroxymethylbilane synthase
LALYQTHEVIDRLKEVYNDWSFSIVPVSTKGDKDQSTSLQNLGQTGIFTKALDDAIVDGRADIGVHSLKDYPSNVPKGLKLFAVLPRDNHLDAFIPGSNGVSKNEKITVLSGSPRRRAFWLNKYPHHTFKDLRGNMHTRLKKILAGNGGIVSAPGLERINLLPENAELLDWMLPAPAQGVMAVIGREIDVQLDEMLSKVNHQQTFICAYVERDFMAAVESGCASPLGALCQPTANGFTFKGALLSLDGKQKITVNRALNNFSWKLGGEQAAEELLAQGGKELMDEIRAQQPKDILCLKEIDQTQRVAALKMGLKLHDIEVLHLIPSSFELFDAQIAIVGSAFGAEQLISSLKNLPKTIWVIGKKAAELLELHGYEGSIQIFFNSSELIDTYLRRQPGKAVYYGAMRSSQDWVQYGIQHVITYRNSKKPPHLARQDWDAILAFSPLGIESALLANEFANHTPIICIGERTAKVAIASGYSAVRASTKPDFTTLLKTLKTTLS